MVKFKSNDNEAKNFQENKISMKRAASEKKYLLENMSEAEVPNSINQIKSKLKIK